jgi:PAS domain S-box-containing protein
MASETNVVRLPQTHSLSWDDCRLLVESVVDYAIFMLDGEGHVATWNAGASRLKGYQASEIVGQHFSIFYPAEDRAAKKPEAILDTVQRSGRYEEEGWRIRKDGSRFWANVVITSLRDERGNCIGFAKVTRDLSERRRNEEDLRRSEERFRLLVENVADYAIYMLDVDGRVATWNLGAERMKGYTAEQIIGHHFSVFFPAEDAAAGKPAMELTRAAAEGHYEDEGWRIRKDGTRFWANAVLTALRDGQGTLLGFAKITRDLTARREAETTERRMFAEQAARLAAEEGERRLRESEERYRALSERLEIVLEGVADGITALDRSGRHVFANRAAAASFGFDSPAQILNSTLPEVTAGWEIFDERGEPVAVEHLPGARVLSGEPTQDAVLRIRKRGSRHEWWTHVRGRPVLGRDGKPELAINIWHDVTARHRRDRQTRCFADAATALGGTLDAEEMLAALAKVLVPGFADWCSIHLLEGSDLRNVAVAHVEPAMRAAVEDYHRRFPPSSDEGSAMGRVIRTGVAERHNDISDEMLAAAVPQPERLAAARAVGMKAVLIAPIRIHNRCVGIISLVSSDSIRCYDTTDQEMMEELGQRAGVALDNASLYRMAQEAAHVAEQAGRAKDEFLATVSHELRTPLNAIVGWSSLLRGRTTDPAMNKPLEVIHRNAQAQVKIVDDILDVSRVITGKFRLEPKPVDLASIVREALDVVRPSAFAKSIALEFESRPEACMILADPERLRQVAWNLLSNAVKFTGTGGLISATVRQEGAAAILSIVDNGSGIAPDFLPFVFDRFQQGDSSITRRVGGLGLGLALVRHIVELHGGQVAVASEGMGKGATFTITLPIRAAAPLHGDQPESPVAEIRRATHPVLRGLNVLVVDDETDTRELITLVLEGAGANVESAESAMKAFEVLDHFEPNVVVSDIGMPGEDGYALMRRIRALPTAKRSVPALALTAFATADDRQRALGAGYTMHLGKPVEPETLLTAVEKLATDGPRAR